MLTAAKKKSSQCICISAWEILWLTLCGCVCSWRCVCKPVCVCCPHPIWTQRWFFLLQFMVKTLKNIYFKKTYAVKHVPLNFQINILLDISFEISNLAMNFCFGNEKKRLKTNPRFSLVNVHNIGNGEDTQTCCRNSFCFFHLFLKPHAGCGSSAQFQAQMLEFLSDASQLFRFLSCRRTVDVNHLHNIWKLSVPLRKLEGLLS